MRNGINPPAASICRTAAGSGGGIAGVQIGSHAGMGRSAPVSADSTIPADFDVEGFLKQAKMNYAALLDKKSKPVHPDDTTFSKAADSADWKVPGMAVNLNNKDGWPITAATFIIVYESTSLNTKETVKFFDYALSKGDKEATNLDYVPLPDKVKNAIRSEWKRLGLL